MFRVRAVLAGVTVNGSATDVAASFAFPAKLAVRV
jgi:hypothetical protein